VSRHLLDASALLALLHDEPGADAVATLLPDAAMSSVNWSEVVQKALAHGVEIDGLRADLESVGLEIIGFDAIHAEDAARLWHRGAGDLSLADRACLATAMGRGMRAVTVDRRWAEIDPGPAIQLIR